MTRDEVIEIWGKANGWSIKEFNITITELEHFAQLIAEHERERILEICKEGWWDSAGIRYHTERGNK
jgi:hypothetical protein